MNPNALQNKVSFPVSRYPEVGRLICHFLDVTATATARSSVYNTRQELQQATDEVHQAVFRLDRGMYGLLLALPGVLDHSKQIGVKTLLGRPGNGSASLLTLSQETQLISWLADSLPTQRQLKLFGTLKEGRVNNARTRRLILQTILGYPNLEWVAVKYRRKIAAALRHAWGTRTTSIIKSILSKLHSELAWKEINIYQNNVIKNQSDHPLLEEEFYQCLSFILGNEGPWTLPRLYAYHESRKHFRSGAKLPPEVMEGIRSTYHPHRSNADVMELTERQATTGQRIAVQRTAKKKGVEIAFDPTKYDLVKLYVYAYEMGLDIGIQEAIEAKQRQKAATMPMRFDHVGIVVDTSQSMAGSDEQKYRPIATAMAIRGVLQAASDLHTTLYTGGIGDGDLPPIGGETSLAETFLAVADMKPDSIFIITDGYENAPAGRLAEVVGRLRQMGNDTPIYQLSPVMAAETYGTRNLSNDVPVLPVNQTINIGIGMIKLMLEQDFIRGLAALIGMVESKNILKLED
jgi:hypothetical protein